MGAEYLFYMKSIETHARAFFALIFLGIGTVLYYDVTVYFYVKIVPKPQYLIKPFLNPHVFLFSR